MQFRHANDISKSIAPKPCIGRYHQRVVHTDFQFTQLQNHWVFTLPFGHGNEFKKDAVVQHQKHIIRRQAVLQTKKAFRRIVGFDVIEGVTCVANERFKFRLIGRKTHAPMHEQL